MACLGLDKELEEWMTECCRHVCWEHREAGGQKPVIRREGGLEQSLSRGGAATALCGEQQSLKRSLPGQKGQSGPSRARGLRWSSAGSCPGTARPPGFRPWQALRETVQGDGRQLILVGLGSARPEVPRGGGCLAQVCVCMCPVVPLPWSCSLAPHPGTGHLAGTMFLA